MGELVKSMAMNLLEGKDLVSVSLPVIIFDARSFLERLTDNWSSLDFATSAASKQTKGGGDGVCGRKKKNFFLFSLIRAKEQL